MVPFIYFCLYTCNISSKAQRGTNLKHKKYARETLFEAKRGKRKDHKEQKLAPNIWDIEQNLASPAKQDRHPRKRSLNKIKSNIGNY